MATRYKLDVGDEVYLQTEPGSHVGPLLGGRAAGVAQAAVHWLNGLGGFRTD